MKTVSCLLALSATLHALHFSADTFKMENDNLFLTGHVHVDDGALVMNTEEAILHHTKKDIDSLTITSPVQITLGNVWRISAAELHLDAARHLLEAKKCTLSFLQDEESSLSIEECTIVYESPEDPYSFRFENATNVHGKFQNLELAADRGAVSYSAANTPSWIFTSQDIFLITSGDFALTSKQIDVQADFTRAAFHRVNFFLRSNIEVEMDKADIELETKELEANGALFTIEGETACFEGTIRFQLDTKRGVGDGLFSYNTNNLAYNALGSLWIDVETGKITSVPVKLFAAHVDDFDFSARKFSIYDGPTFVFENEAKLQRNGSEAIFDSITFIPKTKQFHFRQRNAYTPFTIVSKNREIAMKAGDLSLDTSGSDLDIRVGDTLEIDIDEAVLQEKDISECFRNLF